MAFILYSKQLSKLHQLPALLALHVTRKGDEVLFETINFDEDMKECVLECVLEDANGLVPNESIFLKVPDVESCLTSGSLDIAPQN